MESNIRRLRKQRKLSQRELGAEIGLSQQVISRIERDRDSMQVDILVHLADYFQVSTDYVLGYERSLKKGGMIESIRLPEPVAAEERLAEIDRLERMEQEQRLRLWNTLVRLKGML